MNLKFNFIFISLFFPLLSFWDTDNLYEEQKIVFYSEELLIQFDTGMDFKGPRILNEQSIVAFYEALENSSYEPFLYSIKKHQNRLELNDWLVYELIKKSIEEIFNSQSENYKRLTTWFLLSKLGYDTRLAFLDNKAFIYVRIIDDLYETPLLEDNNQKFAGLTEIQYKKTKKNKSVYLLNFLAAPNGRAFNFSLDYLPNLPPTIQRKDFRFDVDGIRHDLMIEFDKTIIDIMRHYPVIGETDYLITPFSEILRESLIPQLRQILKGKDIIESLTILSTFTRSAFRYKEDENYFGRSKPMIRDEVFFYPYSDCEDRSAVFWGLVEELLDLPMIVVAFPDHLTVAVALGEEIGPSIKYKGKKFYICDPTGPSNSSEIGSIPKGYEKQSFEILLDNL